MLSELRSFILDMIHAHQMLKTPATRAQPLYDPFRIENLSYLERERIKATRYVQEHVPKFFVRRAV